MDSLSYHLIPIHSSVIVKLNVVKFGSSVLQLGLLAMFRINKVLLLLTRTLSLALLNTVLEDEILTFVDFQAEEERTLLQGFTKAGGIRQVVFVELLDLGKAVKVSLHLLKVGSDAVFIWGLRGLFSQVAIKGILALPAVIIDNLCLEGLCNYPEKFVHLELLSSFCSGVSGLRSFRSSRLLLG